MKKRSLFLVLMLCSISVALSKPVGPDQAKKAALTYIKKAVPAYANLSAERLVDITSTTPFREFYVFSIDQKGFILVSGDNNVVPILGFSTSGNFPGENMPDNFRGWLQGYEREIAYIREHSVAESEELNSQWRQLLEDDAPDFEVIIEPLITTTWKQTAYYNNACPLDANAPSSFNGHVPAGPVAVAVGQILNYYRWPEYLPGHTYTHSTYGTLSTDRSYVPYYNMPNQLDASSSTDQVDAVSNFLYNIGVFLETNYGPSGSSANLYVSDTHYPSAYKLLEDYCDYIWVSRIQKSSYSNSSWISNMRQQLWNEMPVLYSGSGSGTASGPHAFILDGYTSDNQFHINWGWGGDCDGYYTIGSLNPSDYDFNSGNYALVDIRPPMHDFSVSVNPQGAGQVVGTQNGQHPRGYQYEVAVEPTEGYRVLNMTINGIDDEYYAHTFETLTEDVHITYNLAPVDASDQYYYCTFNGDDTAGWVLVNDNQTNKWCIGNATSSEWYGTSLYISADNGVTQSYNINNESVAWAYREMTVPAGRYFVQYYWNCIGEHSANDFDYMRVFLVPASVTLTAGTLPGTPYVHEFARILPDGWISLSGSSVLNNYLGGGWERFSDEVEVPVSGDYKLVVLWVNDGSVGIQPPADIDRITFRPVTRNITVTVEYDLFDNTYYGGEVTGSGEYYAGSTCTLHATPWDRTVFRGWYDGDGQLLSSAPTYSFTVTDNDTVYARFEHNSSYYSSIFHPSDTSDWVFVNGNQTNKWCFGQAASLWDDGYGLYISNNGGVSNSYNTNAGSIVYAYLKQPLPAGDFHFSCGWRANGESNYDYMRIFVAPVTDTLIAGVFPDGTSSCYNFRETIPDGWTQLGSTPYFYGDTLWYDYSCDMHIYNGWGYRLVFMWCNDNSVGSQPPAAVGRVSFEPIQYTVAASALPANAGTVLDTGTFTSGYYCTLTAVSAPGYRFAGWKNLTYNVIESTDSVYSFNVWRNENLQAIFVPTNPIEYWCAFGTTGEDDTTGWVLVNDGQTNQWCIGNATAIDNNRSLYISNDNGVSNAYDNGSISISWAYRELDLIAGTYQVSYYWKAYGENSYDWLRAFLVPDEYSLVAGQFNGNSYSSLDRDVLPAGWISLCGPDKLNLQSDWQQYIGDVEVTTAGRYKLAFMWANDGSSGSQPPAAVDYIQLILPTCRKVTGVTVSNVTTNSIDAEWNANDLATSWHVHIYSNTGTIFHTIVSSPSCHITGLNPNTDYELAITPICSSTSYGQSLYIPVHTACNPISLPYTQDFENEVTGSSTNSSFAECWHRLNNATTYFGIPYISGTSSHNHTYNGSEGLYWNNSTSTSYSDYQAITLPSINIYTYPVNTLQLYFWARRISGAPVIKVGVMSNPDDITTFTLIDTVNLSPDQAWHEYMVSLENYTGSGEFVALRADRPESGSWTAYLDDITLEQRPACPRVENIAVQNITTSSANLTWTEQGSATSWSVTYLPEGGSPSDAVTLNSYNSNITITGLEPNTLYTVQITPICSSGLGGTNQTIFRTNCTGLDNLPYTMNFEESEGVTSGSSTNHSFVECWHRLNNATVYYGYPYVSHSSTYNHTDDGSQGLYWYLTTQNESYGNYHAVVLPGVNTAIYSVNTLQLSFWAKSNSTNITNNIQVGVMTDPNDIATFSSWKTFTLNNDDGWHEYTCSFEGYTGSGSFVALRADTVPRGGSSWYAYMDDVTLEVIPQCGSPRDLLFNNVTTTSATISWTPSRLSHNNFVVAYGTGTDPSTMATVSATGTSATLTGLSDGAQYNVFVKTVCGSGLESEWSNIISFSTITIPYVITQSNPYIERFEGSTKWQLINDQTNKWTIGNATNNGGTKALYISDNMGTTNTYTISNLQWSYAVKTFDFPAGSVHFSFDWKSYGERNYDYIRVFLVPTSKQLLPHISPNGQSPTNFNSTVPEGWIALDGGSQLCMDSTWSTIIDTIVFDNASTYNMVFIWCNDGSAGTQPPAAIDNIIITTDAVACSPITPADLPYTENFDSYTTSTTAKTGVSVPCWTLAHQDVAMTDEYKPMVYYSSANAHSGSYSLILNKRGIFVMPEFDGDVSRLQLSFYVKQSMAKYQLQVGVMSDLSNASTFVPVATINNSSTTTSVLQTVDFASYSGSGRYIAFRNVLASCYSGDFSLNYIDDISLELRPASCPAITAADLPYSDNFDSHTTSTTAKTGVAPDCWTLAHQDVVMTDEYKPMVYYASANAHSGNYSLILNKRGIYAMPEFDGDVSTLQLSFYVKQSAAKYQLQVGVMSDLSNAGTFVPVATINNSSTTASVLQTVDFSSYSGSGRYIAFRNVLASGYSGDFSLNYIDDISLELRPASCPAISAADLPYSDNFDSYTTSTTAKTGVAPDCWTLAHQDVAMTDEYKPMVYYASANAHSGSYSLILNKRGIFAMPEFDGDVSTLQLSFYVKQSAAKYQLQVGVMSDLSNAGTFVPVATINNSSTSASVLQTVDFASYSGSGRYIAFRNILASGYSGDFSLNYIDDISLELRPASCPAISAADLPYSDNFDSYTTSTTAKTGVEPDCWTLARQDVAMTDEYKPMVYYSSANAHSGSYSLILNKRGIYAMPEFDGDVSTLQLSFYVRQSATKYQLQVGVMNSLSNADSFTPVTTINNSSTGSEFVTVDFSDYTGTGHYIAFRNILAPGYSGDFSLNYIDDISLELRPSSCPAISAADLPYSDNFDSYTTSTTAKTGVEPDCWTLAHQDVAMTDEYKPMVYYSSANAHSGSYSLILNKRGIYAMPEFDGDVSTLQLSFYVRQSATKYQLQVGVMNSLSNADSFTPVTTINNSSTGSEFVTVDFSDYTGTGNYIAFRNILAPGYSGDFSLNYIDDIRLETRCAIYPDELPYSDNFDSYTTSTTAKTGVTPDCWTLAHQDVTMADVYKPMVYHDASCAHSGSYSLILNKRGIFAMPEFSGDVSTLQLSFYLRQTMAKYQLQVGVMSDLSNASSFVPVATFNNSSTTASVLRTVNFSAYTGSGRYIAFRNILASGYSGDFSLNYIDDITLSLAASKDLDGNGNDVSDNEPLSQKWMTVFPNPTSGMITIEADGEIERIDIFDYTGRCVATVEHQSSVDLSGFASGLYTLRCTLPDRIEVRRVVKQ